MKTSTYYDDESQRLPIEPPILAIPMGHAAGCSLYFSYSLLIALGIVVGIVATFASYPGNKDLAFASTVSILIWAIGCFVQGSAYRLGLGPDHHFIEIGMIGPRWSAGAMSAKRTLQTSVMTVSVMIAIGSSLLLASRWSRDTVDIAAATGATAIETRFVIPGFDLQSTGSLLNLSGWLFLVQIAVQSFPLPRSLGRHLLASSIMSLGIKNRVVAATWIRRGLVLAALCTVLFAIELLRSDESLFFPRWPILLFVSVWLFRTSSAAKVQKLVNAYAAQSSDSTDDFVDDDWPADASFDEPWGSMGANDSSFNESFGSKAKSWMSRRKLRRAMQNEHKEAVDASKLDGILDRLHLGGVEALSRADREVLRRVSESLKKEKQRES